MVHFIVTISLAVVLYEAPLTLPFIVTPRFSAPPAVWARFETAEVFVSAAKATSVVPLFIARYKLLPSSGNASVVANLYDDAAVRATSDTFNGQVPALIPITKEVESGNVSVPSGSIETVIAVGTVAEMLATSDFAFTTVFATPVPVLTSPVVSTLPAAKAGTAHRPVSIVAAHTPTTPFFKFDILLMIFPFPDVPLRCQMCSTYLPRRRPLSLRRSKQFQRPLGRFACASRGRSR